MCFASDDSFVMTNALFRRQQKIRSYTGAMHHQPVRQNHHRHVQIFAEKHILPINTLDPYTFAFIDSVDPIPLVNNLGWLPMGDSPPRIYCPAAVREFFSNHRTNGLATGKFTTLVFGNILTFSIDDLAPFLVLPSLGKKLMSPLEFWSYKFYLHKEAMNRPFAELDDSLKLLHYYINRVYFPRTESLNVILPHDCWQCSQKRDST
ncbi:unnamed protein product [Linum trigynum]|uniref:Uncharacterized protein n=1 Tax=Linum trigynum TaxID=586398 RepID=A0AAV2DEK6_9ROSI